MLVLNLEAGFNDVSFVSYCFYRDLFAIHRHGIFRRFHLGKLLLGVGSRTAELLEASLAILGANVVIQLSAFAETLAAAGAGVCVLAEVNKSHVAP